MSSSRQKMIAYLLDRARDKVPEIRLRSIQDLGEIGTIDILDDLKAIHDSDTDAAVRQAALEAGRSIFLRHHRSE